MVCWCPLGGTSVLEPMVVTGTVGPGQRLWWGMVFSPGFVGSNDFVNYKMTYLKYLPVEGANLPGSLDGSLLCPMVRVVGKVLAYPCGGSSCVVVVVVCAECGCFG